MGELAALHEGQIAFTIATRLLMQIKSTETPITHEEDYGAGISKLIPFMEALVAANEQTKFIVIIDEFDDLDPSFYTGQRGKLFIKALEITI